MNGESSSILTACQNSVIITLTHCQKKNCIHGGNHMKAKVYFTRTITPDKVVEAYEKLGIQLPGKVAVKVHSGEKGNQNYLTSEFWRPMVEKVNGTIVECNTAYGDAAGGVRDNTESHWRLMEEHGWTKYFNVDLMDGEGPDVIWSVKNGKVLKENHMGKNILNYDSMLVLAHFKGHPMGGYGGALKQLSIGCASRAGKALIHSAGVTDDRFETWQKHADSTVFPEAMADAVKAAMQAKQGRWAFVNVLDAFEPTDGCEHATNLGNIGILASLDPVAVDQAAIDLTFGAAPNETVRQIWEKRHSTMLTAIAENNSVGYMHYRFIEIK